jgi:phosphoglycerate dehydrogenase-like enzyme
VVRRERSHRKESLGILGMGALGAGAAKEGCRFRARCAVYRAMGEPSVCREKDSEPELIEIGPSHRVRCHFPDGESIEV